MERPALRFTSPLSPLSTRDTVGELSTRWFRRGAALLRSVGAYCNTPPAHQLKASGRAVWAECPSPWPPPRPSQGGGKRPLWRSKSPSLARLERGIEGERHVQPGLSWCMWGCIAIHLYGGAAKQRPYLIGFARSWTEGLCKSLTAFARAFVGNRRNHCAESCLSLLLCSLGASFVTKHAAARQASFVGACALVAANGRRGE